MNNNDDKFYENLFGSDATSKPVDSDSEKTDSSTERLFDMNAGKPLIGIGDINTFFLLKQRQWRFLTWVHT